jgi:MFS family permease
MEMKSTVFYPFFDPYRNGNMLSMSAKVGISLVFGIGYILAQYLALPEKAVFFDQSIWALGAIISTSVMALYAATMAFRKSLDTINRIEGTGRLSQGIVEVWMQDGRFLMAGAGFATLNISVGYLLGVPTAFHSSVPAFAMIYVGFFLSGFFAGMGLLSIISVIVLHLRFAPHIQHALNPDNPDGSGGIGALGDTLWFFASLIGVVGVLVSIFLVNVEWSYMYKGYAQVLFVLWLGLPYTLAISIVLVPGLAVRRQVKDYKSFRKKQLKAEESRLFDSFKEFEEAPDEEIIATKREINERLENIQTQMDRLRKMRNSHIDIKS